MTQIVVCCGAGGVGKTTTAAALALRFASAGHHVAVITIDPARRLADSLGVSDLANEPVSVDLSSLTGVSGQLDALMLDAKKTFDGLVRRFTTDPERAEQLLESRYYRYVSTKLVGVHEYMAMERVAAVVETDHYDVIVLDTPPTHHAVSFLTAPERLIAVMDERVLSTLSKADSPRGYRALQKSAELVMSVLDKMAGAATLREIGAFMGGIQEVGIGFRERAERTRSLLRSEQSRFVLVTTPAVTARSEAVELHTFLETLGFHVGAVLMNRCVLPHPARAVTPPEALARPKNVHEADWQACLDAIQRIPAQHQALAQADAGALGDLEEEISSTTRIVRVARLDTEIHELPDLHRLSLLLPSLEELQA